MRAALGGRILYLMGSGIDKGGFSRLDHCFKPLPVVTVGSVRFQSFIAL